MIKHSGSFFSLLFFLFFAVGAWSQETSDNLVQRGQYIFSLGGGTARHTVPKRTPNFGACEFPIPMAKIYST